MKRSVTIALLLVLPAALYSQEQKSVLQMAEEAYARQEYAVAGALYKRLANKRERKMPVDQLIRLSRCYQEIGGYTEAARWYAVAVARPDRPAAANFGYGEVLRNLEQYDAARQQYSLFTTAHADSLRLKTLALQSCDSALAWRKETPAAGPLKGAGELNTRGSDLVSGAVNGGILVMSTGLESIPGSGVKAYPSDKRTQQPYYKAYTYKTWSSSNPVMHTAEVAPELLDGYRYHAGPVCFSHTGDTMYVTINVQEKNIATIRKGPMNGTRRLQLFQSVKQAGKWDTPVLMPGINLDGYSASHAALSADGSILYFVSDRPGGLGQTDIWYAERQADGSWGAPVNCGAGINTIASETFPTVNDEGMLYFSSKGYAGFGGYDIYRAKGEKAEWQTPENLKLPFNSGADDLGLVLLKNGQEGYMASNRPGGAGLDDIYHFAATQPFTSGGAGSTQPASPDMTLPGQPSGITGQPRPAGTKHTPEEEEDKRQLEQLKFLYDYNSAVLLPESRQLLDGVAEVLKRHSGWKIVIASFADNRGSSQYNADLSALRCFAVLEYLAGKGIDPRRLYYSNMGEQHPVNNCKDGVPCSEEAHHQNRRTEIIVKF